MRTFGLVGFPLSHSFSQKYFTEKFKRENISDCEFKNFTIEDIDQLPSVIKNIPSLCGLSITIPHKKNVIKYLKSLNPTAAKIGAVNCVRISDMQGFNTDTFGFAKSIQPYAKLGPQNVLVLGTGGASKAIKYALEAHLYKCTLVSRNNGDISYSDLDRSIIDAHRWIINTTPLGMLPNVNECPDIPYQFLTPKHFLYDLTYNPEESLFLKKGKEKGAQIKNGLEMLYLQAEKAWEIWNGSPL